MMTRKFLTLSASLIGMTWEDGDKWTVEVQVPPGAYDFKCVVVRQDGSIAEWEPGENRLLEV